MLFFLKAPLQEVHLEVVPIAGRSHEVNLTAVVLPTEANLTVFYWWIGDSLQVNYMLQIPTYEINGLQNILNSSVKHYKFIYWPLRGIKTS